MSVKTRVVQAAIAALLIIGFGAQIAAAQSGVNAATVTYRALHLFCLEGGCADGANPLWSAQGFNGDFYGTTLEGGANCLPSGCGTIFKITPGGGLTTLYSFCSQANCADGASPRAGLVQAASGNFYGTTEYGGAVCSASPTKGCGTIFEITPAGKLTTLYRFCSQPGCLDGEIPQAGLIQAANGDLYGTTVYGGKYGPGTIFGMTSAGVLTTLYSFCSRETAQGVCPDGLDPSAGLVQAANGNLYGTTSNGGSSNNGTVFEIGPTGGFKTIYSFCAKPACSDGANPFAGLVRASDGNLYGTTGYGGVANASRCPFGCGTIFKITEDGALTTLHNFCSATNCSDGFVEASGLIRAVDGDLYGTTLDGGTTGYGTIFKITTGGAFTTIFSFPGGTEGFWPSEPLIQGSNGIFYGAAAGGYDGTGVVFSLSTGEPEFLKFQPAGGAPGEVVKIFGYGLSGATSVTFNGTPATILSKVATTISVKVPAGASSGTVQVVTPTLTLASNVAFSVLP